MTYAANLEKENVASRFLCVMKPRRVVDSASWTNVSGSIYKQSFDYGEVVSCLDDGAELTEASSSSVSSNEFYYDSDSSELYINIGSNPSGSRIVATYELYFGTFDAHWYRDPVDSTTREVYYEPLITQPPEIQSSISDVFYGFLPTFSSQIGISNATKYLQRHIYDSSFYRAEIKVYHYLDELTVANLKLITKGYTKEISSDDQSVNFQILDANGFFDDEYRNPSGTNFFSVSDFPGLDPQAIGKPIRKIYGVADGMIPINVDYEANNPVTSDNREFIVGEGTTGLQSVTGIVSSVTGGGSTKTFLNSATGFRVGDSIYNSSIVDFGVVTGVNASSGNHFINHTSMGTASAGNTILRSFIGNVKIVQDDVLYTALFNRDYIVNLNGGTNTHGFTFSSSLESFLSLPRTLSAHDRIYCRVYGPQAGETLGGSSFGSVSTTTNSLTSPIAILWTILKGALGLSESDFDTAAFEALESSITDEIGIILPSSASQRFPTYKEIILQICQTILCKAYLDLDQKFTLSTIGPISSTAKTIEDDEILKGSFSYNFSYQDILSKINVEYLQKEVSDSGDKLNAAEIVTAVSSLASELHQIEREKTFKSLHILEADAQKLADRLSYYFGERRGIAKIATKFRFFDHELEDNLEVSRDRLAGSTYVKDTLRDRNFATLSTRKNISRIEIELDDQKGIEDNQGDW